MGTITTTTVATPLIWPSTTLIDRDPATGALYVLVRATTANTFEIWRSTNEGGSWSLVSSLVRANVSDVGSIFVHSEGWVYWTYRTNESGQDRIYFRRGRVAFDPFWQGELLVASPANGTHIGGSDMAVVRTPSSGHFVMVGCGVTVGAQHGLQVYGVYIDPVVGNPSVNNGIIAGTRQWLVTGSGRITPSLDLEHVGDSHGSDAPHVWAAFGRTSANVVRIAWTGGGWTGPTSAAVLSTTALTPAQDSIAGRWDGNRFLVAVPNPASTSTVVVYERNRAHNTTTIRTSPAHTQGVVKTCTVSYNTVNGDFRVWAVGTGNADLHYVDYVRATGVWSGWGVVSTTDIIGTPPNNFSVRRSSYGNARYDVLMAHATPTPNTIVHMQQALVYAPNTPTWNIAGMAQPNGGAADAAVDLVLDWDFADPDPTDTQGSYALSRQIGAGALAYWRNSDSTWQPAEVQNTSAASTKTLLGWNGGATEAAHTYRVKVWDAGGTASGYSETYVVVPSAKVNPTITSPAPAGTITSDTVTPTWTVGEETAYRLTLSTNPGGVLTYDSGWVSSSALTQNIPERLPDLSGWTLSLQTRNLEGLLSNVVTVNFTVDYLEPPAPLTTATPSPGQGTIIVTAVNAAVVGAQPAVVDQDIYRRPVVYANLLSNPTFEVDVSTWTATGCTAVRSTTQQHSGAASVFLTPSGVDLTPRIDLSNAFTADCVPGDAFFVEGWFRPTTANKPMRVGVNWLTSGLVYVSTSLIDVPSLAGAWLYIGFVAVAPATAAKASPHFGLTSTPAVGDTVYVDDVRCRRYDANEGVRVAAGIASGATIGDWGPAHGVAYEYRSIARGANGTSIAGPWTA